MVPDARELHVDRSWVVFLVVVLCDMFKGLTVSVSDRVTVVNQEHFAVFLPGSDYEMLGVDVVVDEVLEMVVLEDRNRLRPEHKHGLETEPRATLLEQTHKVTLQLLKHNKIIILLLSAPVHVWDADTALHGLEDLPLLQDGQVVDWRLVFYLLSFEEESRVGLGVDGLVEQVLVLAGDFGGESEATDETHLNGFHINRVWVI